MGNRSVAPMRAAKIGYIVISACLCVFGCLLMSMPTFSAALLGVICGVLLIVFGAVRLAGYFSRDLFRLAFQYDLTLGIVLIVMGVILLLHPAGLMTFLCVALGLYIFADGLFKLQIALESRRFGIGAWWLVLALAVLTALCGVMLMFRPGEGTAFLMVLLGVTLLVEGVLNLCTVLTTVKIIRHQVPDDVIDVDVCEESGE